MTSKDERIGFRVSGELKNTLLQIARKEGRSLAQICELLLRGGINEYVKEGSNYLQRLIVRPKEKREVVDRERQTGAIKETSEGPHKYARLSKKTVPKVG